MDKHTPWRHTFDDYGDEIWFGGKDEGLFSVVCPAFDAVIYFGSGCNHTARKEALTQLAEFIVDAGNVYSETGLTARELLNRVRELENK